jgi:hypothetical protein
MRAEIVCAHGAGPHSERGRSAYRLAVQASFRVSASALRLRRIAGVAAGPLIGALLLLRIYLSGSLGNLSALKWVAVLGVVIYLACVAVYGARGWMKWASNHRLEVTDTGLLLIDGDERELRSFGDITRLDIRKFGGAIFRARLTYAGGLKQDLSLYDAVSDLVALLKTHVPPERVHE